MFNQKWSSATIQKWGGIASFVMVIAMVTASLIYLMGNLNDTIGPFAYSFADFLYGPVYSVSLVTAVLALRERIGEAAPRRMNLALLSAFAAACAFVVIACIRSSNRHYHLSHPDLHLESSEIVLTIWATQVASAIGAAFHFLGWAFVLIGSVGWASRRLPRILSALYLWSGIMCMLILLLPDTEASTMTLILIVSIWQGILLLKTEPRET